jgi:predicted nucleic acid-binding protein
VTFFLDTNVVVYAATDGPYRDACVELLAAVAEGADARTSTAVLEEVWHVELSGRAGNLAGLAGRAYTLLTPLLSVTDDVVAAALALRVGGLGANDRVHAATCALNGIEAIVTADAAFDGIHGLRRVDPLDVRAVGELLGAP